MSGIPKSLPCHMSRSMTVSSGQLSMDLMVSINTGIIDDALLHPNIHVTHSWHPADDLWHICSEGL